MHSALQHGIAQTACLGHSNFDLKWPYGRSSVLHILKHRTGHTSRHLVVASAKAKTKSVYNCTECGHTSMRWLGLCPGCGKHNTLVEELQQDDKAGSGGAGVSAFKSAQAEATRLLKRGRAQVEREGGYGQQQDPYDTLADNPSVNTTSIGRSQSWVSNSRMAQPLSLKTLSTSNLQGQKARRMILTGRTGAEINRVLGGGVVCGSLVLMGGEPGVGKSTLSLQIAAMLAQPDFDFDVLSAQDTSIGGKHVTDTYSNGTVSHDGSGANTSQDSSKQASASDIASDLKDMGTKPSKPKRSSRRETSSSSAQDSYDGTSAAEEAQPRMVLYVSGEETCEQVYDRAERMGLAGCETLHILPSSCMDEILPHIITMRPAAVVVDSIQTMYLESLPNVPGAEVQLKECCNSLLRVSKDFGITVFAIGHVTRSSSIAGPKALEHMVDAVLKLEGDMSQAYRLLRAAKNRFGTTDEVGVFCMDVGGLHAVADPSAMFVANRSSGNSAVAVVLDGSRVLVLEVQALVTGMYPGATSPPVRQAAGANRDRLNVILINVLHKYVMRMHNQNVVVSVTGGMQIREPAADLAIAVAVASSYYDIPVPRDIAAIGEVDLGGGLRPVRCQDLRLMELAKLGLKRVVIPKGVDVAKMQRDPRLADMTLMPCSTLLEALQQVLGPQVGTVSKQQARRRKRQQNETDEGSEDEADD